MSLGESIRKGAKWLTAGSVAGQVMQFAFGVALARILVPEDFGLLVTVQIFTGIAGYFASGGTGDALVRAKVLGPRDCDVAFTLQLGACALIYATFFALAPLIALWFRNPLYTDLTRVSALSFLIRPFLNIPKVLLRRDMRYDVLAKLGFVSALATGAISVGMALAGMGVWALVIGGMSGSVLAILPCAMLARWRPAFHMDRAIVGQLWAYGAKVSVTEMISYARRQVSNFLISRSLGPAAVGLFNKADSLSYMPVTTISSAVYDPVFRALATVQDNRDQSRYIYLRTITLLTVYTLPFYVGMHWLAEPFIVLLFGVKWAASAPLLEIMSLSGLFFCIGHAPGAVLAARNELGREIVVQAAHLVLLAGGTLVGMRWGVEGVAWAVFATYVYSSLHMSWLANRSVGAGFTDVLKAIGPGLFLNAFLVAALLACDLVLPATVRDSNLAYLLVAGAAGGLVYLAAFLLLPIPALSAEALRWRRMLHLVRA
ncbi:MAG: lipopolysaccharide biosynthesis protein [Rhodocyclaceae bacterium]